VARLSIGLGEFSGNEALLNGAIDFFRVALRARISFDCKQQKRNEQR
jgi:hypothetical protein